MLKWYQEENEYSDVILSSRVRLARNLDKYPFSIKLTNEQADDLVSHVKEELGVLKDQKGAYSFYSLKEVSELDRQAMVERHLISPLLSMKEQSTGCFLSEDESAGLMVNEEDHIRIQTLAGGMNIGRAYERAMELDDLAYDKLHFAYSEKFGYLTSCPTNTGTGLRASYMVFLPALSGAELIGKLSDEVSRYGVTLRGMYGEGSEGSAGIYQISNQKTLGSSESEIMDNLNNVVYQVVKQERKRREYILLQNYDEIMDQVYRSYGVLKYAKKLTAKDAVTLLSQVKFGMDAGMLKIQQEFHFYEMVMRLQPASLQYQLGKNVGSINRDKLRAEFINKNLPEVF